jgi:cytochrome P450
MTRVYDPPPGMEIFYQAGPVLEDVGPQKVVRSYSDVDFALRSPALSSALPTQGGSTEALHLLANAYWATDGELHAKLKGIAIDYFTPTALKGVLDRVPDVFEQLVRKAAPVETGGLVDISGIADSGAFRSVCLLTGLPEDSEEFVRKHVDIFTNRKPPFADLSPEDQAVPEYLRSVIAERERQGENAPDDLLMRLIRAYRGELGSQDRISERQLMAFILMYFGAGGHTLGAAIAMLVAILAEEGLLDDSYERVKQQQDPGRQDPVLAGRREEAGRLAPAFPYGPRTAVADVELPGGCRLARGELVLLSYAAANRDPDVFKTPDAFNPDRENLNRATVRTFGGYRHLCTGAEFARAVELIALETFLRLLPNLQLEETSRAADLVDKVNVMMSWHS